MRAQTRDGADREDPPQDDREASKLTMSPRSTLSTLTRPVDELATRRELRAWIQAAWHLNSAGYAAAVPPELVDPLRRRGLTVWPVDGRWAA
jgi:hypothetical protein